MHTERQQLPELAIDDSSGGRPVIANVRRHRLMDRLEQKLDMMLKLGRLLGPLEDLVEHSENYDDQERAETLARYFSEYQRLNKEFLKFCRGQAGHSYDLEFERFANALGGVPNRLKNGHPLCDIVTDVRKIASDAVHAVPVPRSSVILEAQSPFTAYCKLRALCEADCSKTLKWFDPYFGPDVFHRYLKSTQDSAAVTLITCEPGSHAGRRNVDRWNAFLDVSRLFAQERGASRYRLLIASSLHDRWLVLDEKRIYALGGSAKDAAFNDLFTISSVSSDAENAKKIEDAIDSATEWFGPTAQTHR